MQCFNFCNVVVLNHLSEIRFYGPTTVPQLDISIGRDN